MEQATQDGARHVVLPVVLAHDARRKHIDARYVRMTWILLVESMHERQREHRIAPPIGLLGQLEQMPRLFGPEPAVQIAQALEQIEALLATDDTLAGDLFAANRSLLLATLGGEAMQLERHVVAFDYPGALTVLRALTSRAAPANPE